MSGILLGMMLAALGAMLISGQQPAGLIFIIFGFVSLFTGIASQQERRMLRQVQMGQLPTPGMPALDRPAQIAEDEARASAVRAAANLPAIPISLPLQPGEFACFRTAATLGEIRQMPRLGGGYMTWDAMPAASDEGEVYVTNRRLHFSGSREVRDIPLPEIALAAPREGILELQRVGRPSPILFGVPFPRELAAYIERARREGPASLPSAPFMEALPVTSASTTRVGGPAANISGETPSYITCAQCGAANGLSANFCQNCAAPLSAGRTPTLNYPPQA